MGQITESEAKCGYADGEPEDAYKISFVNFYADLPRTDPFVSVEIRSKGQTLAIVEAMKLMNETKVILTVKLRKFMENGQAVEYDSRCSRIV
ncbi:MAG: hypothetical protein ACLVB1_03895 [Blautia obeum]